MCEPATLSLVLGGIGTAVSAVGAIQQGQAASNAAQYQAAVDRNNSILANRARVDAIQRGQEAEAAQRRKTSDAIGRQRAAFASSGIEVSGSALDVLGDTAQFGELDAKTTRGNAEREAASYAAKAANFTSNAGLNDARAESASTAGFVGGLGTALSGANTVASNWYRMR